MRKKRKYIFLLFSGLHLASCAGKDIYPDLKEDPSIARREWTLATRKEFAAGDKGSEYANSILIDNTLVFGNSTLGLVALYPTINQVRWVLPIQNGVLNELASYRDHIFFGAGDGYFYSVSAESGKVNWRYQIKNQIASKAAFKNGRVFVTTSDDTVYAFDAGSGEWLWHYKRRSANTSTILGASEPLIIKNEVVVGMSDGYLVALSINDGQLKWQKKIHDGRKFVDVDAHPVFLGGTIYVPSYDGSLYAIREDDRKVIWKFEAGGSRKVVIEGDRLYLPSSDGLIYCLKRSNGALLWKFEIDSGSPTELVLSENYVVVASSHRFLYFLGKNTGKPMSRFSAGYDSGFYGSPTFDSARQLVYILSQAGNLYAFKVMDQK